MIGARFDSTKTLLHAQEPELFRPGVVLEVYDEGPEDSNEEPLEEAAL